MRRVVIGIAAAVTATALYAVAPAAAQEFGIRDRDSGISVRIGDRDRFDRDHFDRRRYWREGRRDRVYVVGRDRAQCRQVTTRIHRPDGSIVIRKRSSC